MLSVNFSILPAWPETFLKNLDCVVSTDWYLLLLMTGIATYRLVNMQAEGLKIRADENVG